MQSQSPGSSMGSQAILPLLMMDSDGNNQELIMFMSMMNNQKCQEIVKMPEIDPKPKVETVYRTWKLNSDGTRTLMDEHEVIGAWMFFWFTKNRNKTILFYLACKL